MVTYCFVCPDCGYRVETPVRDPAPRCGRHSVHEDFLADSIEMRRDYGAEAVAFGRVR